MAQIEEKEDKTITKSPKRNKAVNKANTKPQEHTEVIEEVVEAIQEAVEEYPEYHVAEVGDNPFNLAYKYDTSMEEIKRLNPDVVWLELRAGRKVRVK